MELNANPISENNPIILLKAVSHNSTRTQCQIHTLMYWSLLKPKWKLYPVTCKGKVLHSTFKHRKLKIIPQKYTWCVGYKCISSSKSTIKYLLHFVDTYAKIDVPKTWIVDLFTTLEHDFIYDMNEWI